MRLANEAGGRDNITCVVVDVVDDSGRDPATTSSSDRITAHTTGGDAALFGAASEGVDAGDQDAKVGRRERRREAREARVAEGRPRRRVLTWRVGLFVLAFLAIVGFTVGVIVYMGRNTYYVGVQDQQVVIFRGRPGGVAWIQPELAETTAIPLSEVPAARVDEVEAGVEQSSLDDARRYVANLQDQIDSATTTTTTTSTTTTTVPPAAPVTVAPG